LNIGDSTFALIFDWLVLLIHNPVMYFKGACSATFLQRLFMPEISIIHQIEEYKNIIIKSNLNYI